MMSTTGAMDSPCPPPNVTYTASVTSPRGRFTVAYDAGQSYLGPTASAVLQQCEAELDAMCGLFPSVTPKACYNIYIHDGIEGGCNQPYENSDIYCGYNATVPNYTIAVMVAELTEQFEVALSKGWAPNQSHGEALSRVVAELRYPDVIASQGPTAQTWANNGRPDWITSTKDTDKDDVATGCGVLFLFWLHGQLGFSWQAIIEAGAPTLAQTYTTLTGRTDAFSRFVGVINAAWSGSVTLASEDVFPLWNPEYVVQNYATATSPGLAALSGTLYMSYRGETRARLWLATYQSGNWTGQTSYDNWLTDNSPALAASSSLLNIFWRGSGSSNTAIWTSTFDGQYWRTSNQWLPQGQTDQSPAAAILPGAQQTLVLAYKGQGDSAIWVNTLTAGVWSGEQRQTNFTTDGAPALAAFNGQIVMAWKNNGASTASYATFDGTTWSEPAQVGADLLVGGSPALAAADRCLFLAARGTGTTDIWTAIFDGTTWVKQRVCNNGQGDNFATATSPALCYFNGNLYMAWRGKALTRIWSSSLTI